MSWQAGRFSGPSFFAEFFALGVGNGFVSHAESDAAKPVF